MNKPLILASTFSASAPVLPSILKQFWPSTAISELKVLCITTAANTYTKKPWLDIELNALREVGLNLKLLDIAEKSAEEVKKALLDIDIICITGGNSYYLLEQMQKCAFKLAFSKALKHGALYMGSSAGAAIASPDISYVGAMDDPSQANLNTTKALSLIDFYFIPHADSPKYGPIGQKIINTHTDKTFLSLNDNQLALIHKNSVDIITNNEN